MIAPLRARHRVILAGLALLLPLGFAAALAGRDDETEVASLPAALADDGPELGPIVTRASVLHAGVAFEITRGSAGRVVAVRQTGGEPQPNVLAYWTASTNVDDELPADAVVLGSVVAREHRFAVPHEGGSLVLFSLARGELVVAVPLEGVR